MQISTVSIKGQITLPSAMRKHLGIKNNDKVVIEEKGDLIMIKKAPDIFDFEGIIKKSASLDKEREGAMKGASERASGVD